MEYSTTMQQGYTSSLLAVENYLQVRQTERCSKNVLHHFNIMYYRTACVLTVQEYSRVDCFLYFSEPIVWFLPLQVNSNFSYFFHLSTPLS